MSFGPSPDSWIVRSDKDTHFTTALAQHAIDIENLGRAPTPAIIVSRITIWADQNLDWDITLWRNNDSQPSADLDLSSIISSTSFSALDGFQIAATGPHIYNSEGLDIRYQSDDGNIFVGLINRNASAKNAGATGEFVVELQGPII